MYFPAGLDSFGPLDWDDEFEQLSDAPLIDSNPDANQPADIDMSTNPDGAGLIAADYIDECCPVSAYQQAIEDAAFYGEYHDQGEYIDQGQQFYQEPIDSSNLDVPSAPVSSPTSESPSWYPHMTATSPEVAFWSGSPFIYDEIHETLDAWCYGDTIEHGIPYRASILMRATRHLYCVPHEAGIGYPLGATGYKNRRIFPEGWEERVPLGPSKLSQVVGVDDDRDGDEKESDDEEAVGLSFEKGVETRLEREIEGGSLQTRIVDEDTALFHDDEKPLSAVQSAAESESESSDSSSYYTSEEHSSSLSLASSEASFASFSSSDPGNIPEDFERDLQDIDHAQYDCTSQADSAGSSGFRAAMKGFWKSLRDEIMIII